MTTPRDAAPDVMAEKRDAFLERLLESTRGTFEIFSIYLGVRLGFYEALAAGHALTSTELASRTSTAERYAREWLEQQTVAGILEVDDEKAEALKRRFSLPAAYTEVLVDQDSVHYLAPLTRLVAGAVHPLASVLEAYRTGGGVHYAAYGVDLREGQAGINRAMFMCQLGSEWLPAMPDVHARLTADPPARIADIGCGAGWSTIAMAQSYPRVAVDGFDLDGASIDLARANVEAAGLADRVTFHLRDASAAPLAGRYDLVTAFECLHDMSQPVSALGAMRHLAGDSGAVLVADERVGEAFTAAGDGVEWMMYCARTSCAAMRWKPASEGWRPCPSKTSSFASTAYTHHKGREARNASARTGSPQERSCSGSSIFALVYSRTSRTDHAAIAPAGA